jgi:copper chaperone CopZ
MLKSTRHFLAVALLVAACAENKTDSVEQVVIAAQAEISVPTIQCGKCAGTVEEALKAVAGVSVAKVALGKKIVSVTFDESTVKQVDLEKAIAAEGYNANNTLRDPEAYLALDKCCQEPADGGGH